MTKKIFISILLVASVVLLASMIITIRFLYDYFDEVREKQIRDQLEIAAAAVEDDGESYLAKLSSDNYRLTWVAANGTVLYDTQADAKTMENYLGRSEIQGALAGGEGESSRYSATLLQKTEYHAKRLSDGTVLRISVSHATAGLLALGMLQPILIVLVVSLVLSGVLASRMSKRIVEPLNRLDLEHPLENDTYEEIAPLLGRINQQQREIRNQLRLLQRQRDEFTQITGSMKEGLVLLDTRGTVLSINHATQKLFGADNSRTGRDFLTVDRSPEMTAAIRQAKADGFSELRVERNGRVYQFEVSRIDSDGEAIGTVILSSDITEQETAERIRKEFTANVSHELKTPLQGIIGSAELLEKGMAKQEDVPHFIEHIRTEAARMVALIEDIIRLSQLDEGATMPREDVDMLEIVQEAIENLHDAAAEKNVTLSADGQSAEVNGVRRLLYEVVYNLCDNAIKYNKENGRVEVNVTSDEKTTSVTVKDTGIGIPPRCQGRVFERFYRVDKSHSRTSGGTGLGLSIVKHAVHYHYGHIKLRSELDKGTEITVIFPKKSGKTE
ncbi:MAG: sensor histidine kinase [Thermoguttaceae bacterium]|jgi:two-component system phosphate regulon sensor histidine kinase PhoR